MGSITAPLPINSLMMMFNNLEIIGNVMYARSAYLPLLAMVGSAQLNMSPIKPRVFKLPVLERAMEYASTAHSLELVVVSSSPK
jgi:alcohol dehydrogenase